MDKLTVTYFLIFLSLRFQALFSQEVIVNTTLGQVKGNTNQTAFGLTYYSFLGIPYAKPPLGDLRFKAPTPAEPWEGVRDATQLVSPCLQLGGGSEDCLVVNVITPKLPNASEPLLPTMVYIHGGAFLAEDGSSVPTGPDWYLGEGVVLANMEYRLGPLGFLSTGDSVVPGNNGLKDQVLALKWIQDNIAQFGGRPDNITIFGMSAGGASVHYQFLSPLSKGLFQAAISQSGSGLNPWAFERTQSARNRTLRYAKALGANTTDSKELVEFLRTLTAQEIIDGVGKAQTDLEKSHGISFFVPTVEEDSGTEDNFLPQHPLDIMRNGNFNQVVFVTGSVTEEGIILLNEVNENPTKLDYYNNNFQLLLPEDLEVDASNSQEISKEVRKLYFGDKELNQSTLVPYLHLIGDTQFVHGINTHARMIGAKSTAPVYHYYFTYDGVLGSAKRLMGDICPGIGHSDEEGYLFYHSVKYSIQGGSDAETHQRMIKLWTNVAKRGNPTPEPDPLLQNVIWSPVTQMDDYYLDIGGNIILKRDLLPERMGLWDDIYTINSD